VKRLSVLGILLAAMWWTVAGSDRAIAKTEILRGTSLEVDHKVVQTDQAVVEHPHVKGILAAFDRAEEAMQRGDLDGVLAIYAKDYNYRGLKRSDIRKIWSELFTHYRDLSSAHVFTRLRVSEEGPRPTAEITCTGHLRGTPVEGLERVTVDSWYGEVHYLIHEDGIWRIRGNAGVPPKGVVFGTAPHPLF